MSGLSEEDALNKFGFPSSANDKIWKYSGLENIYVFLEKSLSVSLYPNSCNIFVGDPIEFKVLAISKDIEDVTFNSEFIFSDPQAFEISGQGTVISKVKGEYQIIADYNGVRSNPSYVTVAEMPKDEKEQRSKLVAIDVFPYRPRVNLYEKVNFLAFGSFIVKDQHITKDITKDVEWYLDRIIMRANLKVQQSSFPQLDLAKFFVYTKKFKVPIRML